MMLNKKLRAEIEALQTKYPVARSALIPALHLAQSQYGYLPREIQDEVAELFNLTPNEVNSLVTFYDMFYDKPVGEHIIHVCKNVSCALRGADSLLEKVCNKLGVRPGQTTADGKFTVISSECLAACDRAPMMLIDEMVLGPINENDLEKIISDAKKGPGHSSAIADPEAIHG